MFNHNRGLWGYTGAAADGELITIQSTGMGGPSAAIVVSELADLGARRLLRVGTCGALHSSLTLGELLIASDALAADGTSRALGAVDQVTASPELLASLTVAADGDARTAVIASTDLFYDPSGAERQRLAAGAVAVEMEIAALFALAPQRGVQAAALLIVSDLLYPERTRIATEALRAAEHRMGELAVRALA